MMTSIIVDYFCGLALGEKRYQENSSARKTILFTSLFVNLLLLFYFKYFNFFIESVGSFLSVFGSNSDFFNNSLAITLPLGISFYTFQSMSYTIDVYRGEVKPARNFAKFCAYVSMFPQLIAGPIVRYRDIEDQINDLQINLDDISQGIKRFIIGLAKKVLIANNMGIVVDTIFATPASELSMAAAWIGILAYSLQIFFDFSGYSDMAIGLGRILGFKFPENFNFPYIAKSIQDFWRRWHISLSTWFRDYLYIPLGGNRKGVTRTYINLLIVFFITGLWHGASWNFIFWGMFHGLFLIFERLGLRKTLKKLPSAFAHIYTLLVVIIGWVFFRAENFSYGWEYCAKLFNFIQADFSLVNFALIMDSKFIIAFIAGIILSTPIYYSNKTKILKVIKPGKAFETVKLALLVILFAACVLSIASDSYNPFLYYKF